MNHRLSRCGVIPYSGPQSQSLKRADPIPDEHFWRAYENFKCGLTSAKEARRLQREDCFGFTHIQLIAPALSEAESNEIAVGKMTFSNVRLDEWEEVCKEGKRNQQLLEQMMVCKKLVSPD